MDNRWRIYHGKGERNRVDFPEPPPWRKFPGVVLKKNEPESKDEPYLERQQERGQNFQIDEEDEDDRKIVDMVNAALYLRRPLLITGKPGSGKSSLAYSVAYELEMGEVLHWPITSSTKLSDGLYQYDAIGRLQETNPGQTAQDIGKYIRLGPLGAALVPADRPRVLLIDEIDKSDIDLPNDLLHVFEEGEFEIPELIRLVKSEEDTEVYYGTRMKTKVSIAGGRVSCKEFPFVILTSNDEREFPPAFLRRCLRLEMKPPTKQKLIRIVQNRFKTRPDVLPIAYELIDDFQEKLRKGDLATDQLLNAVHLACWDTNLRDRKVLVEGIFRYLSHA